MGGSRITAACLALWGLMLIEPVVAEQPAPIVQLQQPMTFSSQECDCSMCQIGDRCRRESAPIKLVSHDDSEGHAQDGPLPSDDIYGSVVPAPVCDEVPQGGGPGIAPFCNAVRTCDNRALSCDAPGRTTAGSACGASMPCDTCPDCGGTTNCSAAASCNGGCGDTCIDWTCLDLCSKTGFWLRTETLLWWTADDDIPTLATSSPIGTPIDDTGVLGVPTTSRIFNDPLFGDARWGGRVRFGWWGTGCNYGIDGSVWGLLNEDDEHAWESVGDPAIARPFYNVDPLVDGPDSQLIGYDGVIQGTLKINTSSEMFGGDLGIRKNICCASDVCGSTSTRIDCYAGYRYFKVREGLRISESLESTSLVGPSVLGTTVDLYDDFQTRNEFHGGTIGLVVAQQYRRFTAEMTSRLSLGNIAREARIDGATTVTVPGLAPVRTAGGLLAQPTNIGVYKDDDFAVLPEINFNLMYNVRNNTRLMVGYSFMYLGDLVRPGGIVDSSVNGLQLDSSLPVTGPQRPTFAMNDSRLWVMGLNFGVEVNF